MKKRAFLFIFFVTILLNFSFSQENAKETEILNYKQKLQIDVFNEIQKIFTTPIKRKDLEISVYPYCFINEVCHKNSTSDINKLNIDTTTCFAIIKHNNKYIGITGKPNNIAENYYAYNKENDTLLINQMKMFEYVSKFSSNFFFIYFLNKEKFANNYIGYIKDNDVNIIGDKLLQPSNLNNVIVQKYGSVSKYCELKRTEFLKDSLLNNMSIDEAKIYLRNSYSKWLQYNPEDTLIGLNLLINEIDDIVSITSQQRILLQKSILIRIREWDFNNFSGFGIPFLGEEISNELVMILTQDQFFDFLKEKAFYDLKVSCANELLYYYFTVKMKISDVELNEVYRDKVFK